MQVKISVEIDAEKLRALEMTLEKEHSSVQQYLSRTLDELYEKKVPEPVREFIGGKTAAKAKRPPRPAAKAAPGSDGQEAQHE